MAPKYFAFAATLLMTFGFFAAAVYQNTNMEPPLALKADGAGLPDASILAKAPDRTKWASRYNGPGNFDDQEWSLAISPDGSKIYVTGFSYGGSSTRYDYATIAYNAATGAQIWTARYNGPGNADDMAFDIVVSPDGSKVYVTGESYNTSYDYATVAYTASAGIRLWVAIYNGAPIDDEDNGASIAIAPDGSKVYVTGWSMSIFGDWNYVTVAYLAATGKELWVAGYDGPAHSSDIAYDIVAAPDGSNVYVTGTSLNSTSNDYATVAYDASTGAQRWVVKYNGYVGLIDRDDCGYAIAITPDSKMVFVTGSSFGDQYYDIATVAYDTASGTQLWVTRYNGPLGYGQDLGYSIAVAPDGKKVYVTGLSDGIDTGSDIVTLSYSTDTGAQIWVARYNGPGNGPDGSHHFPIHAIAVAPGGGTVYVTGASQGVGTGQDFVTLAYGTRNGARSWVQSYNGPANGADWGDSVVVALDGRTVYVSGTSKGINSGYDYTTIAYKA